MLRLDTTTSRISPPLLRVRQMGHQNAMTAAGEASIGQQGRRLPVGAEIADQRRSRRQHLGTPDGLALMPDDLEGAHFVGCSSDFVGGL